ncbi:hypothetical protein, partial [Pyrobaculum sp.]|uniref:hypothetical protein n=1 Tax=Pyrobaculum sp. TaxID=2004705 RepID=UPI003D0AF42D
IQQEITTGDTRKIFTGWTGTGCPATGTLTVVGPVSCTAQYREEYRVVVEDPQGRLGGIYWTPVGTAFTMKTPLIVELSPDARLRLLDAEGCKLETQGATAMLVAERPARCRLRWQKEYRVVFTDQVTALYKEQWLAEGARISLSAGPTARVEEGSATVPPVVERGQTRYVLRGWSCGGTTYSAQSAEVAVDKAMQCQPLWTKQYLVQVVVMYDGRDVARNYTWVDEGSTFTDSADRYKPPSNPLTPAVFADWTAGSATGRSPSISMIVDAPLTIYIHYTTNYTPAAALGAVAAGGAVAATMYRLRKRQREEITVELEVRPYTGEETRVREEDKTKVRTEDTQRQDVSK